MGKPLLYSRLALVGMVAFLALALRTELALAADIPRLTELARTILGPDQGVYIESADGTVLLAQAAQKPVHPASVSKVATTLALLRNLGADYRFVTTFSSAAPVHEGTLAGDLWVESKGDPFFVDENALLVGTRLKEAGIYRVAGTLNPRGSLTFDWQDDPRAAHLRSVLSGTVPAAAWSNLRSTIAGLGTQPKIDFGPDAHVRGIAIARGEAANGEAAPARTLVIHRSQSLLSMAKALNDYSNNIFKPLADAAGGAAAVQALARSIVPAAMRTEITLGDGAGTDARNRLSPRAAVALLRALERELALTGHTLVDILPVAGIDDGTLRNRLNTPEDTGRIVGKTGTFGDYGASALVGALTTADRGTVYFAILNHNVVVPEARRRQDRFVHALLTDLHTLPWNYQRDTRSAVARAEALVVRSANSQ